MATQQSDSHDDRMARMSLGTVYPLYLAKVVRKGRTEEELLKVIGENYAEFRIIVKNMLR